MDLIPGIFEFRGISADDWYLSFDPKNGHFHTGGDDEEELLMAALVKNDPELSEKFTYQTDNFPYYKNESAAPKEAASSRAQVKYPGCDYLKQKSIVALKDWSMPVAPAAKSTPGSSTH